MRHTPALPSTSPIGAGWTDAAVRPQLRVHLGQLAASEPDAVLLEELALCRKAARADFVLVNGALHGYEIKSERDTLRRLGHQVACYGEALERATLVVARLHLELALPLVPQWWEVLVAEFVGGQLVLTQARPGEANPAPSVAALASLLWRDEVLASLEQSGHAAGVRSKPRRLLWARLCDTHSVHEVAGIVRTHLKARAARQSTRPPS